jgi:hypothetical protein
MHRFLTLSGLALVATAALWGFQNQTRQRAAHGWEYAVVENWRFDGGSGIPEGDYFRREIRGRATICYVQESGCKAEDVQLTSSYLDVKGRENPSHFADAQQAAVAKAIALLGSAGWELVGNGPALNWQTEINNPAAPVALALYFKRIKQ